MTKIIKQFLLFTILSSLCLIAKAQYSPLEARGQNLIKDPEYIIRVNESCLYFSASATDEDRKRCAFNSLGYTDPDNKLFPMGERVYVADFGEKKKLFIVRGSDLVSYGYYIRLDLYMQVSDSFIPSTILIYGMTEHGSRDSHIELYYYLEENFLYLAQFEVGEEGFKGNFWRKYKIDFREASFDLIESMTCKDAVDEKGDVIITEKNSTVRVCGEVVSIVKEIKG